MEDWKKVMWSDESRLTLFQSDGSIRVRREAGEVMHPSCLVPTVQACGGSAVIFIFVATFFLLVRQYITPSGHANQMQASPAMNLSPVNVRRAV